MIPARLAARALLAGALLLVPLSSARAAPLKTWGADPSKPDAPPDPEPAPPTTPSPTRKSEPEPRAESDESAPSAAVRKPGRVGLRYHLEHVEVRGNTTTLSRVVLALVPFTPGDTLDVDDKELELTRFRLLATGFFRDVQLSLRKGTVRGSVVLVISVVERNTVVVNDVWLGLSADADPSSGRARPLTAYGGLDVSETNLAGTGIALGGAFAIAERQLALRTRFSDPRFLRSSWTAEAQLLFNNAKDFFGNRDVLVDDPTQTVAQDYAVLAYQRFGGRVGAGHDVGSVATRVFFDYRLEKVDATPPLAASHKRGSDVEPIDFDIVRGSSVLSTVSATLVHDTRDEAFLPNRGWHVLALAEASLTPLGSDYPYGKLVVRGSRWMPLPWAHVLRIEGIFGSVFGDAPMFEKFYIGDYSDLRPHRALDLAFDRRAAPNFLNNAIAEVRYGDYAARVNVEYRVPLHRGRVTIYGVDFFASTGVYGVANGRDLTRPPRGYSGLSTVPVDLTFNLGIRADTAVGGFSLGIANFIGFVPIRSEGQ